MFRFRLPLMLAVLLLAWGCSEDNSPTAPTPPEPTTEVFTGTLNRSGAVVHQFATVLSGTVTATLSGVTPNSATPLSVAIGVWSTAAGTCSVSVVNEAATQGTQVVGQITTVGGVFCIRVADPNATLSEQVSYELQVVHPQ